MTAKRIKNRRAAAAQASAQAKRAAKKTRNRPRWEAQYAALAEFKRKHGHCRATRTLADAALFAWVVHQRQLKRQGTLLEQRRRLLDELGFLWSLPPQWSARVRGAGGIPPQARALPRDPFRPGAGLAGQLVHREAQVARHKGKLGTEQIRKLDELEFEWVLRATPSAGGTSGWASWRRSKNGSATAGFPRFPKSAPRWAIGSARTRGERRGRFERRAHQAAR